MAKVGPHFDHNQVLSALIARPAVHLRNQVEILEGEDCGKIELTDLIGVQNGVVEIEDDHGLLLPQHLLDKSFLMLLEGAASHKQIASLRLLLEEITGKLTQMLLLHLLETELAT